ncbi:MAG: tetratricopeptide repeat protein [Labrys sp. (in: a-proteobacteria)]
MVRLARLRRAATAAILVVSVAGTAAASTGERRIGDPLDLSKQTVSASGSFLAGRLAVSVKDAGAASAYLAEALLADPKNIDLLDRTFLAHVAAGRLDEAATYAQRLLEIDPRHRIARMMLGTSAIRAKRYEIAEGHFRAAVQRPILDLIAPLMVAWSMTGSGNVQKAVALAERVRGEDWYESFRNFTLGTMLDVAGQPDAALAKLKLAYDADPSPVRVSEGYARALARAGRYDEALKVVDDFLLRAPRQPAMLDLRDDLVNKRPVNRLIESVQQGAADTLVAIAVPLSRQGGQDFALAFLQLALGIDPESPTGLIAISDTFSDLDQPQNAAKALAAVPESSPLKRNAEIALGMTLDRLDKTDEGVAHLEALIKANPSDFDALITLGNIFHNRKRFAEAADAYSKAIALVPKPVQGNWSLFYYRGIAYERTKRWPLAEADFKKALELFPNQPDVLNYLGYSWVDQGINLEEGLAMITKAVEQKPDSGYIVDSLGWAYYRIGNYPEAVKHLERAVELRPNDSVINDHLGDAYWRVGRKLEATFQWRHALEKKPEPEEQVKIERKLKEGLPPEAKSAETTKNGSGG